MKFFPDNAAGDVLGLGCGEPAGVMLLYGLPEQVPDQRRGGDVLGGGPAAQLRVQFPIDAQVQRHVQGAGLLGDFGLAGVSGLF
ncbi:MAG: hypothetical protein ACRDSZ_14245 [Pseudonocardiaceae bacterium]